MFCHVCAVECIVARKTVSAAWPSDPPSALAPFSSSRLGTRTGMGPIACAAASGDVAMIRFFAEAGAPLQTQTVSMQECPLAAGT